MVEMTSPSHKDWLVEFFDIGNSWDLTRIDSGDYSGTLQFHLQAMINTASLTPTHFVLPFLDNEKCLWFYILGSDRKNLTEMKQVLEAHLGAVATVFDSRILQSAEVGAEEVLLREFPHGFSKFHIPVALNDDKPRIYKVFQSINSAVERIQTRPRTIANVKRPVGRILSDFFIAYDRLDGPATSELCAELRANGDLNARNLMSIELQTMAANGSWTQVLSYSYLGDLLRGRVPGRLAEVLIDAVHQVIIRSNSPAEHNFVELGRSLESLRLFFLSTPDLRVEPEIWKVWCIGATACGFPRIHETLRDWIHDDDWIKELTHWAGLEDSHTAPNLETDVISRNTPVENASELLRQILDVNQIEGLQLYKELLQYPERVFEEIRARHSTRVLLESIEKDYAVKSEIGDWSALLQSLSGDSSAQISVEEVADESRDWEASSWDLGEVSSSLYDLADSEQAHYFREVIPVLRTWLSKQEISVTSDFIEQLITILVIDDTYSHLDLILISDLVSDMTSLPHSKEQYKQAVNAVAACWDKVKSVKTVGPALDFMDELLDSVCADPEVRLSYWNDLQGFAISNWTRLELDLQFVIREISIAVTGASSQFPSMEEIGADGVHGRVIDLSHKKLAIYSLTESAAQRARSVLTQLFPGLEVHLNHDHGATKQLMNLAKTADYFIFASRSAAHQAFYPVVKERKDLIYPAGKGSSSLVRCFLESLGVEV